MADEPRLPDAARRLVEGHIDSVGRLDVLLTLHEDPRVRWTAAELAARMRAPRRWTQAQLEALRDARLAAIDGSGEDARWAYDPADDQAADAAEQLVAAYARDRRAVVRQVFAARPSVARAFSDAFRVRRRD